MPLSVGERGFGRVLHSVGLFAECGVAELLELGGVAGDRVCGAECLFGVPGQGLVVEDLGDVGDSGPGQPVVEVGGREVAAELRSEWRPPYGGGVTTSPPSTPV